MPAGADLINSQSGSTEVLNREVDKILRSSTFRGSEVLRNLLSFLCARASEGRPEPIKVKEIATLVFKRSEDFDSQSDSVVRVHMGRLRAKLAEYYVEEAPDDDIVVSIPKGAYALCWHPRHPNAPALEPITEPAAQAESPESFTPAPGAAPLTSAPAVPRSTYYAAWVIALLAVSSALAFWAGLATRASRSDSPNSPALKTFWHRFISAKENPLLVFSNLKLIGSLDNSLHIDRGDPADRDKPSIESWSTLGEVMGVYEIGRTLALFHKPVQVKRGQLLTWDDAKDSNVIFIGGPLANTPLQDISIFREFKFENRKPGIPAESGAIVNVNPRHGEAPIYTGPQSRPFDFDYAVISRRPAFNDNHEVLALAGITEYGTQGAAEFLSSEDSIAHLLEKLTIKPGQPVPYFEALLRVKVQGGVPVHSEIILVHKVS